jgi:hypothetical protein
VLNIGKRCLGPKFRSRRPNASYLSLSGTAVEYNAFVATTNTSMRDILFRILSSQKSDHSTIPITFEKNITVGDIVTIHRVAQKGAPSVVNFIQRIDPAEKDADPDKLRCIVNYVEKTVRTACKQLHKIYGPCLIKFHSWSFRLRPLPRLLTVAEARKGITNGAVGSLSPEHSSLPVLSVYSAIAVGPADMVSLHVFFV